MKEKAKVRLCQLTIKNRTTNYINVTEHVCSVFCVNVAEYS